MPERAPVFMDARPFGTIAWAEHLEAFDGYAARFGRGQSAERIAERGGFSHDELCKFLGRAPTTFVPKSHDLGTGADRAR